MASVFISILSVMGELGMTAALIQRDEKKLFSIHWHTAFFISFTISVVVFILIVFVIGPFAAFFYQEPKLELILSSLGVVLLFDSFSVVQKAKLIKSMNFRALSLSSILSIGVSSIVGISLAYKGFGVWALVVKTVLNAVIRPLIQIYYVRWIPKLRFNKKAFTDLFGFSLYVFAENIFTVLLSNIDFLLIGKFVGATGLGLYSLAFTLTDLSRRQVMGTFNRVFFPVYSSNQNNKDKASEYFLKVIKYTAFLLNPLMIIMFINAEYIVLEFFGESWRNAEVPLKILSISVITHTFGGTSSTLIRGVGKARLAMLINLTGTALAVPVIIFGAKYSGIIGASFGVLVHRVIIISILLFFVFRLFSISIVSILESTIPSFIVCATIIFINFILMLLLSPTLLNLLARIVIELTIILISMYFLLPEVKKILKF